jgi:hypothetical protein
MAVFRQAILQHLREDTGSGSLVEKLGGDATRIKPRGKLLASDTFPAIALEMSYQTGSPRTVPFSQQMVNIYCYTRSEARNVRDWITLDTLVGLVIARLDKVLISDMTTTIDGDFKPFEVRWDGYVSRDLFDEVLRADYRWVRFRTFGVNTSTQT